MTKKKGLLLGSGAVVLILAAVLIITFTGGSDATGNPANSSDPDTNVAVNSTPGEGKTPDTTIDVPKIADTKTDDPATSAPDAVLDADKGGDVEVNLSEIEKDAEPPAPPVVKDEGQLTNPDKKPEYQETDTTVPPIAERQKMVIKKTGKSI